MILSIYDIIPHIHFNQERCRTTEIPVIEKTPVDEALINDSEIIDSIGEEIKYDQLNLFDDNRDSGVNMFVDNCEMLDMLLNKPRLMLVDDENVYVNPLETV